jgi:hypothetical protein
VARATDFRDQPDAAADRESLRPDLGRRLADLPPSHPSSLRDDTAEHSDSGLDARERGPGGPDRDPEAKQRDYWTEVPRFQQAWADHVRRWPAEKQSPVDRSRDPEGSWRGDGNQYLSPEQHAQANDVIAEVRRSEETVSGHMRDVERENDAGGTLHGWEFRLKQDDRLKEKIAEVLKQEPSRRAGDAALRVPDAIRYTFCFNSADYSAGYLDVKDRLGNHGYQMIYHKNHWCDDLEYKGINTRWITPGGQRFEVQFHTPESLHAKQEVTHSSYERIRGASAGADERGELSTFQREVSSWIPVPEGVAEIPD